MDSYFSENNPIEKLKRHLIEVVEAHELNFLHPEVLKVSQQLDDLIIIAIKK